MNRFLLLIIMVLALFSSCHTQEKVIYFQDMHNRESFSTQTIEAMKLQPGDKVSIIVSSAATPDQAVRYNLVVAQQQVGSATARQNNQVALYTIDEHGDEAIWLPNGSMVARNTTTLDMLNNLKSIKKNTRGGAKETGAVVTNNNKFVFNVNGTDETLQELKRELEKLGIV